MPLLLQYPLFSALLGARLNPCSLNENLHFFKLKHFCLSVRLFVLNLNAEKLLLWCNVSLYSFISLSNQCVISCFEFKLSSTFRLNLSLFASVFFFFFYSPGKTSTSSWRQTMNIRVFLDASRTPSESIRYINQEMVPQKVYEKTNLMEGLIYMLGF